MENSVRHPHLEAYRDLTGRIDEGIQALKAVLKGEESYFVVQRELKTALFRITDEAFLERIRKENNTVLLREVEKASPHKERIVRLIADIDAFEAENRRLVEAILQKGTIDGKELEALYPYLCTLATDTTSHDRIPAGLVAFFGEAPKERCRLLSVDEYAILCYLLLRIKEKGRYHFAYPALADELLASIEASEEMPPQNRVAFYREVGEYYAKVARRAEARACYQKAAAVAKENGDLESAAYAMQKYYRLNQKFPKAMREAPDEEVIQEEFGKFAPIVLRGIRDQSLKVDPVEFTEEFANAFQDVMWKVEAQIDQEGDFHSGYQRWQLMEAFFAEKKIRWRSPKQMNPDMMFH